MRPIGEDTSVGDVADRDDGDVPLLEVLDLRTTLGSDPAVQAVDGISFELRRSQTLAIVGESGSGKSVMVRSLMNILPAGRARVEGRVLFEGRRVDEFEPARARHFWGVDMAMVFQDPMTSLNPVVKIGQQVGESLRYHLSMSKSEADERALELLSMVELPDPKRRMRQYPHELSGGMRQRVTIAIALACNPKLLIADEPTTALDVTVQKQILGLLESLAITRGMAMILITHDLAVASGRADRIAVMYAGRFVELAPAATLVDEARHPYTRALLGAIPKLERPSHGRLPAISGRPPDLSVPRTGCSFAPRCEFARERCLVEDPTLVAQPGADHSLACFHPVGTPQGDVALAANRSAGRTPAGLDMFDTAVGC